MSRIDTSFFDETRSTVSVGERIRDNTVYTTSHPAYIALAARVQELLAEINAREAARRAAANALIVYDQLDPFEIDSLSGLYPEFSLVPASMTKPGHSVWTANQYMANALLDKSAEAYSDKAVHHGGNLVTALAGRKVGTHIELDPHNVVHVHAGYEQAALAQRTYADVVQVQNDTGVALSRPDYDLYLNGKAYNTCWQAASCSHQADVFSIDLSTTELSPMQVASAMVAHGATMGQGFFIHHPSMLVKQEGELCGTGVKFRKDKVGVKFLYPDGVAGVAGYSYPTWAAWLTSHQFDIGVGAPAVFQLEIMRARGCFMFFRMVRIAGPMRAAKITHALALPTDENTTIVRSWRLTDLAADPNKKSSWVPNVFTVRTRTVQRVLEFAMQVDNVNFTRSALRTQIKAVNNRWVLNGTSVEVATPLSLAEVEDLTTAIFSYAFVQRFESSRLTAEAMKELRAFSKFAELTTLGKLSIVTMAVVRTVARHTVDAVGLSVQEMLNSFRKLLGVGRPKLPVHLELASSWVDATSVSGTVMAKLFGDGGEFRDTLPEHVYSTVVDKRSAGGAVASAIRTASALGKNPTGQWTRVMRVVTEIVDTSLSGTYAGEAIDELVDTAASLNLMDDDHATKAMLSMTRTVADDPMCQAMADDDVVEPVFELNEAYSGIFPEVARQDIAGDTFRLSLDPQDRVLSATHLSMPRHFGPPPRPRAYYGSKVRALNVPKRQNTGTELLSAVAARNMAAPNIAEPQVHGVIIPQIWDNFLDKMCLPDARVKLKQYQADPVGLSKEAFRDWGIQATADNVRRVTRELEEQNKALENMSVSDYLVMIKSDVKPTLSNKPVSTLTAPQVIVYQDKPLSALYSSIFRQLVRRFLSLLKPNVIVNLLKDNSAAQEAVARCHPFGTNGKFLENDFEKYDKSQGEFVFALERFIFEQLGMNAEFLQKWELGHVDCKLRALSLGMSLHLEYQRKSGDPTTSFGNVIVNAVSVAYAYKGLDLAWAVFIGDDSLAFTTGGALEGDPIRIMAEVFNLGAKNYMTDSPYFASSFVVIDDFNETVKFMPDPIKRIEKLSMSVSADEPMWDERHVSFADAMKAYRDPLALSKLSPLVMARYAVNGQSLRGAVAALATLARDPKKFRAVWEKEPQLLEG